MNKTTVYIDIEDDITAIIEKVKAAEEPIVALVPPKKSVVLQSAINLKLLRKAAKDNAKKFVLISSDPALLPLAGSLKIHVARNLNSLPAIPDAPAETADTEVQLSEDLEAEELQELPVGILDKSVASGTEADTSAQPPKAASAKPKKILGGKLGKKLAIPNFDRFPPN